MREEKHQYPGLRMTVTDLYRDDGSFSREAMIIKSDDADPFIQFGMRKLTAQDARDLAAMLNRAADIADGAEASESQSDIDCSRCGYQLNQVCPRCGKDNFYED